MAGVWLGHVAGTFIVILTLLSGMALCRNMDTNLDDGNKMKHAHSFLESFLAGSADSILKGRAQKKKDSADSVEPVIDPYIDLNNNMQKPEENSPENYSTEADNIVTGNQHPDSSRPLMFKDYEGQPNVETVDVPLPSAYITPKTSQDRQILENAYSQQDDTSDSILPMISSSDVHDGIDRSMTVSSEHSEPSHYIQDSIVGPPPLRETEYFTSKLKVRPSLDLQSAYFLRTPPGYDGAGDGSYTQLQYKDKKNPYRKSESIYGGIIGGLAGVVGFLFSKKVVLAAVVMGLLLTLGITGTTPRQFMENLLGYTALQYEIGMNVTIGTNDGTSTTLSQDFNVEKSLEEETVEDSGFFTFYKSVLKSVEKFMEKIDRMAYQMMEPILQPIHDYFIKQVNLNVNDFVKAAFNSGKNDPGTVHEKHSYYDVKGNNMKTGYNTKKRFPEKVYENTPFHDADYLGNDYINTPFHDEDYNDNLYPGFGHESYPGKIRKNLKSYNDNNFKAGNNHIKSNPGKVLINLNVDSVKFTESVNSYGGENLGKNHKNRPTYEDNHANAGYDSKESLYHDDSYPEKVHTKTYSKDDDYLNPGYDHKTSNYDHDSYQGKVNENVNAYNVGYDQKKSNPGKVSVNLNVDSAKVTKSVNSYDDSDYDDGLLKTDPYDFNVEPPNFRDHVNSYDNDHSKPGYDSKKSHYLDDSYPEKNENRLSYEDNHVNAGYDSKESYYHDDDRYPEKVHPNAYSIDDDNYVKTGFYSKKSYPQKVYEPMPSHHVDDLHNPQQKYGHSKDDQMNFEKPDIYSDKPFHEPSNYIQRTDETINYGYKNEVHDPYSDVDTPYHSEYAHKKREGYNSKDE